MRRIHLHCFYRSSFTAFLALCAACGPPEQKINPPRLDIAKLEAPEGLEAFDTPGDAGGSITLKWKASPTENTPAFMIRDEIKRRQFKPDLTPEDRERIEEEVKAVYRQEPVIEYRIHGPDENHGLSGVVASFSSGINFKKEATGPCEFEESGGDYHYYYVSGLEDGLSYRFRLELVMGEQVVPVPALDGSADGIVSASSRPNWFAPKQLNLLITVIALMVIILLFIKRAQINPKMFIRKIAGLKAVDESMDRATELGKTIYYMVGLGYMSELPTIASVNILQRIARQAARNDLRIKVPCWDPVVMSVAQDVVREAYLAEGKSPKHVTEDVFFVSNDRFSYAASVDGLLVRDRPSTNFFMGNFQAESLLMTEVGSTIDAVQISGTDQPSQLPFFVTTTDYTLIGEELYAASAYLSRDAMLLGSLRGQDVGKIVLALAILAGAVLTTLGIDVIWKFFA